MPARFRERLGAGFFITIGEPDRCLALYPATIWEEFCARLEAAPVKDAGYRAFVRHLFAHTEELTCDSQGRMLIPPGLRAWAGIEKDIVSIGSLTRVEVWSKDRYVAASAGSNLPNSHDLRTELGLY